MPEVIVEICDDRHLRRQTAECLIRSVRNASDSAAAANPVFGAARPAEEMRDSPIYLLIFT
jgi:hypothetical protein